MQQGIKKLQGFEYLKVVFLKILNAELCQVFANQVTFVQGYNLEVHDVIKYTRKHRATVIISRFRATVIISRAGRNSNGLSSPLKVRFTPC